jgi:hypothetical protein
MRRREEAWFWLGTAVRGLQFAGSGDVFHGVVFETTGAFVITHILI